MRYKLSILVMIGLVFWLAVGNGADGATETFSETINKRVAELIRQLGSDDWQVREKATEELIEIGPLAIGEMQRARNNPDAEIRERAQKIIPLIQWKEAFIRRLDRFISQLRTGKFEDTVLFQDVMMFLSRDESVFILLDLLKDSSQSLAIKQQIVAVLSNNSAVSFKPVTNNLLELIQKEKDEQIRVGLLRILAKAGKDERSVAMALQLLKEGTPNMKSIAINILVDMGASSAVPEIMKAIKDADANVKNTAIYAFSRLKTEETTRELVIFMKEEPPGWLRAQAVAILANYNDAKLIPEFLAVLKSDKDFDVLRNTLYALQRFKGDKTIPPALLDFMKTASPQVQPNILSTFQALGDRSVVPELIKMLEKEMDYNGFHAMLGTLQSFAGNHKFTPQIVPDSLKNDIIAKAKDWWEKNK